MQNAECRMKNLKLMKLGVLCSGRGTDLQSIIDSITDKKLDAEISIVLTDKPNVMALTRAEKVGIKNICVDRKSFDNQADFARAIVRGLAKYGGLTNANADQPVNSTTQSIDKNSQPFDIEKIAVLTRKYESNGSRLNAPATFSNFDVKAAIKCLQEKVSCL